MSEDEWRSECREIAAQRERLTVRPAPLMQQQQSVLQTLVGAWNGLTADERKQTLAGIFDSITASAEGVDRLEPCADWRPFMVAAIPSPVLMAEDVEGVNGAEDGGQGCGSDNSSPPPGRARMAPAGGLNPRGG
jgi:hypothetical protein